MREEACGTFLLACYRAGLARAAARGRYAAQLDAALADLGPMPDADRPNTRALWVAGLINPVSKLGLALEVRPDRQTDRQRNARPKPRTTKLVVWRTDTQLAASTPGLSPLPLLHPLLRPLLRPRPLAPAP